MISIPRGQVTFIARLLDLSTLHVTDKNLFLKFYLKYLKSFRKRYKEAILALGKDLIGGQHHKSRDLGLSIWTHQRFQVLYIDVKILVFVALAKKNAQWVSIFAKKN